MTYKDELFIKHLAHEYYEIFVQLKQLQCRFQQNNALLQKNLYIESFSKEASIVDNEMDSIAKAMIYFSENLIDIVADNGLPPANKTDFLE